jgi:hypothetical protein
LDTGVGTGAGHGLIRMAYIGLNPGSAVLTDFIATTLQYSTSHFLLYRQKIWFRDSLCTLCVLLALKLSKCTRATILQLKEKTVDLRCKTQIPISVKLPCNLNI